MACSDEEFIRDMGLGFRADTVADLFLRRLDVKSLVLSAESSNDGAHDARADHGQKAMQFQRVLEHTHLEDLLAASRSGQCTIESVNSAFLAMIVAGKFAKSKLDRLIRWLDEHHPDVSMALRDTGHGRYVPALGGVPASSPVYTVKREGEVCLCERCVAILSPLLDNPQQADWEKLYDRIGRPVCPPSRFRAVEACGAGRQTSAMLGAWCRLQSRGKATVEQLLRLLHGAGLFAAVDSLARQLPVKADSTDIWKVIRDAQERCSKSEAAAATVTSPEQPLTVPQQESLRPY